MNSICITNNDVTLTNSSDEFCCTIYGEKRKEKRVIEMITYGNHHKHEDFSSLEFVIHWDLQQNSMQLPAVHYVHKGLMQQFHPDSKVV
jgi:hypothetical protein